MWGQINVEPTKQPKICLLLSTPTLRSLGCIKGLSIPPILAYILISSLVPILLVAVVWAVYLARIAYGGKTLRHRRRQKILNQHIGWSLLITCKLGFDTTTWKRSPPHRANERAYDDSHIFRLSSDLVLPTVAQVQFRGLNCLELESGKKYLRIDTSIECNPTSGPYARLLGITIPFILFYQSIPILWWYGRIIHRHRVVPSKLTYDTL